MGKIHTMKDLPKEIKGPNIGVLKIDSSAQNFLFAFAVFDFILKFLLIKNSKEKIEKKEILNFGQKVANLLNNNFDFFLLFAFCLFLFEIINLIKKILNERKFKN